MIIIMMIIIIIVACMQSLPRPIFILPYKETPCYCCGKCNQEMFRCAMCDILYIGLPLDV